MANYIWENGEKVTNAINNLNITNYCVSQQGTSTENHLLETGEKKWIPKPYGPPSCGYFAVLHRPEVNRWLYRGCNFSKCKKTPEGKLDCRPSDSNPDLVCDLDGLCGEHLRGIQIGDPEMSPKAYLACNNDAPGGLVDPRADMDLYTKTNEENSDHLRNGFIMDGCECQVKAQFAEMCSTRKTELLGGTSLGGNFQYTPCKSVNCDKYTEKGKTKPFYPSNYWQKDLAGEVWSGYGECRSSVNADVEEFKINYNDDVFSNNTCGLYIQKWAKTCEWCKKQRGYIPAPDTGLICAEDKDCYGSCIILPDEWQPAEDKIGKIGFCVGDMKMDCNICDANIWEHIPGGWQAVVDPQNPLHELAKLSYIPKKQELDNSFSKTCENSGVSVVNYNNSGLERSDNDLSPSVSFCDAGPYQAKLNLGILTTNYTEDGCVLNAVGRYDLGTSFGTKSWDNNKCANVCGSGCAKLSWNDPGATGDNVWDGEVKNSSLSTISNGCNIEKNYVGPKDINKFNVPDSTKIMCERNPQITGYGTKENDPSDPTRSNYHIAMNWLKGTVDLSEYGIEKSNSPVYNKEQIKEHVMEALRCCNGLTPNKDLSRKYCIPASACPSSDFCKDLMEMTIKDELPGDLKFDLYKFANKYPEGFDPITFDGEEPAFYAKMYCELMSGGGNPIPTDKTPIPTSGGKKGYDKKINTLCRKALYNYAIEPVEVEQKSEEYLLSSYKLPLRIFDKTVYDWCKNEKLKDVTPNQYGVCDMLLGKTCQQLQVDGWINENWKQSPILRAFVDKDGNWVEKGNPDRTHSGVTAEKISQTCGCFLLGAQCKDKNCSYYYCGVGENNGLGPGKVSYDDLTKFITRGSNINKEESLRPYGKQGTLPKWDVGVKGDFTCVNSEGESSCFTGCNYVNYYDICWNAGPDNRKMDVARDVNRWDCNPLDNGDSCQSTEWFSDETKDRYSCFGVCPVEYVGFPNCGTNEWFRRDKPIGLTPNEKQKGVIRLDSAQGGFPLWQNFYAYDASVNTNVDVISIPGWSSEVMLGRNGAGVRACQFSSCNNSDSIRPYGVPFGANCGTSCNVRQQQSFLNNGTVSANSIIFNNDAGNACQFSDSWTGVGFNSDNKEARNTFIQYLGSENNCSAKNTEKEIKDCITKSKMCINTSDGDNCQLCGDPNGGAVCNEPNCADSAKNHTCCTAPTTKPEDQGEFSCHAKNFLNATDVKRCSGLQNKADCDRDGYCSWDTKWASDNKTVRSILGNNITYICQENCPSGTYDLVRLQQEKCGGLCGDITDENVCNKNPCGVCSWISSGETKRCAAKCPLVSKDAPRVDLPQPPTVPPTVTPTVAPTVSPGYDFWTDPRNPLHNLSPAVQIFIMVLLGLAIVGLGVGMVILFRKWRNSRLT